MSQRDLMRHFYQRFRGNRNRVVVAYAEAERRGTVIRQSNTRNISAEEYASRLYADGMRKGWLQP
jgi:hypothetical protein